MLLFDVTKHTVEFCSIRLHMFFLLFFCLYKNFALLGATFMIIVCVGILAHGYVLLLLCRLVSVCVCETYTYSNCVSSHRLL